MKILVINSGSSSIKTQLYNTTTQENLFHCILEEVVDHTIALSQLIQKLLQSNAIQTLDEVDAFAHRVVHGGSLFSQSVIINAHVMQQLDSIEHLAPLHNPHNTAAIKYFQKRFPNKIQVAVFDTAFHQTMPQKTYMYPLPYEFFEQHHIRKYGFHGSSHAYLAKQTAKLLQKPIEQLNCITLHLGNGASICAIQNGKSIDTSMGFTPLQGLMMGTRCGDIDPASVLYVMEKRELCTKEMDKRMNKESGLLGIYGKSSDFRDILEGMEAGDDRAELAFNMFTYRVRAYIGSYAAALGGVDAICFTGGIGENALPVREKICEGLEYLGVDFDKEENSQRKDGTQELTKSNSKVKVYKIQTNEELVIAQDTYKLVK